jgi:hypothetical protein
MSVRWRRRTGRVVRWAGNGSGKDDGGGCCEAVAEVEGGFRWLPGNDTIVIIHTSTRCL